jgi:peptidoglycan/LPS O-acetylase OafA/YrhL
MGEVQNRKPGIKYRPDIDGLRAVAVLSVLAFHVGGFRMPGGFVGVDVFFVISGYLISAIVFSEIAASKFSVLNFYERRIRRIFPALFCMLIAFSVVASFYLLPTEFVDYGKSLLAATTSVSNFYFWQHSGYFDSPTSSPLLHTWSLAVEEQFYILFPIFLVIIRRFFPTRLRLGVVVLFILSLAASAATVAYNPTTAFYMPYTRAWELLLGTMLSLGIFPRLHNAVLRNIATLAGIGLIFFSIFMYTRETLFPGLSALVPCVGSMLIIGAGEFGPSLVSRVLSWRPVVFVGLISYSLYLWHWPIIVLHAAGLSINLNQILPHAWTARLPGFRFDMIIEVVASFVLGTLSWRFVERPFRSRPLRITRKPLFALSAATVAALIAFSVAVISAQGFTGRFPAQSVKIAAYLINRGGENGGHLGDCFITDNDRSAVLDNDKCLQIVPGKNNFLMLGDSHAWALWMGLHDALPEDNILLASVSNCRPLVHPGGSPDCIEEMKYIFEQYLPTHPVKELMLQARWKPGDMKELGETIAWTRDHGIPVIVFGPVPEYDAPLPRLLAYSISAGQPGLPSQHLLALPLQVDAQMKKLAVTEWHVPYVSVYQATCGTGACTEYADQAHDVPLMNDADHLNERGSDLIARRIVERGEVH